MHLLQDGVHLGPGVVLDEGDVGAEGAVAAGVGGAQDGDEMGADGGGQVTGAPTTALWASRAA